MHCYAIRNVPETLTYRAVVEGVFTQGPIAGCKSIYV